MRAVRLESIGSLTMRSVEKPVAVPGELLVRITVAGICGSDRHMYKGE
ncbi:iditol 2-dehydrogenase, partial [Rhizobium ruizarguesonis]